MPSYIGKPADRKKSGALIHMQLWIPKGITNELAYEKKLLLPPLDVTAQIDTGATRTVIQRGVAARLGLPASGTTSVAGLLGEYDERQQYSIRLLFPQGVAVGVVAVEGSWPEEWNIHCFIGRDVLKHGLLIHNGLTNTFTLIFRGTYVRMTGCKYRKNTL